MEYSCFGQSVLDYNAVSDKFENFNYDYSGIGNKPCINGHKLNGGNNTYESLGFTTLINTCTCCYDACIKPFIAQQFANYDIAIAKPYVNEHTEAIVVQCIDTCMDACICACAGAIVEECVACCIDACVPPAVASEVTTAVAGLQEQIDAKSTVTVCATGTSVNEAKYITINGTEYKIAGSDAPVPSADIDYFRYDIDYSEECFPDAYDMEAVMCTALMCYAACCIPICTQCVKHAIIDIVVNYCFDAEAYSTPLCVPKVTTLVGTFASMYASNSSVAVTEGMYLCTEWAEQTFYAYATQSKNDAYLPIEETRQHQRVNFYQSCYGNWLNENCYTQPQMAACYEEIFSCPAGSLSACTKEELKAIAKSMSPLCTRIETRTLLEIPSTMDTSIATGTYNIVLHVNKECNTTSVSLECAL